jgi:serine/threonine-protein kinase
MEQVRKTRLRRGPLFTVAAAAMVFGVLVTGNTLSDDPKAPAVPVAVQAPAEQPTAPGNADPKQAKPAETGPFAGIPKPGEGVAPAQGELKVYYGRTDDDSATVAIVTYAGRASAYLCDVDNVEVWFDGPIDGKQLDLAGGPGNRVRATLEGGGTITGEVSYAGTNVGFQVVGDDPTRWMLNYQGPIDELTRSEKFMETALGRTSW